MSQREFEYESKLGLTYDVVAEFSVKRERNYGADADGRRGIDYQYVELDSFEVFYGSLMVTEPLTRQEVEKYIHENYIPKESGSIIDDYNF